MGITGEKIERMDREGHTKTKHITQAPIDEQRALVKLGDATKMLAEVRDAPSAKHVMDLAAAAELYATKAKLGDEAIRYASGIKLHAERKLGQYLRTMPMSKGGRPKTDSRMESVSDRCAPNLSELLGMPRSDALKLSSEAQRLAEIPDDEFEAIVSRVRNDGERLTANAVRNHAKKEQQDRERENKENAARVAASRAEVRLTDAMTLLNSLPDGEVDLLLTDPPYSTDVDDITSFAAWLEPALRKLRPSGRAYVCIGAYPAELLAYLNIVNRAGWLDRCQVLVWTYRNTIGPAPAHDYKLNWQAILHLRGVDARPLDCPSLVEKFSVQDINAPDGRLGDRYHAWQKPDELADRIVRHAARSGDLVVDPYACTGTFLLAAAKHGCKAIGCDISEENLTIAEQRGCLIIREAA